MCRSFLLGLLVAVAGCGALLSSSEEVEPPPRSLDASADAASDTPVDGAANPDGGALCAAPEERFVSAKEDTCARECSGTITYGAQEFCHIGFEDVAVMYLSFDVPANIASALASGRVASARLVLVEDEVHDVNKSGALGAHVLRNDWVAGRSEDERDGADLCRRTDGDPGVGWGAGGVPSTMTHITEGADYGASLGTKTFTADDTQITIPLDLSVLDRDWKARASSAGAGTLSLLVQETGSGSFVAASADHASLPKPTIVFDVCP